MSTDNSRIVAVVIERALLDIDYAMLSTVERLLQEKYNTNFTSCYENPQYLKEILEKHHPEKHAYAVDLFRKYLSEFELEFDLEEFLDKIKPE